MRQAEIVVDVIQGQLLTQARIVKIFKSGETIASIPGFGMAPVGHLSYSAGPNMRAGRTQPCSVRVYIDPIPPKGRPRLPTCHRQSSSLSVAPTSDKPVRVVGTRPIGTS